MGRYLGVVAPLYGRWTWPFRSMEIGDYFLVKHEDRNPEDVRNIASVRASQLGIRISVEKCPQAHPYMTKVRRVAPDEVKAKLPGELDYSQIRGLLMRQYDLDADQVPWHALDKVGERIEHPVKRVEESDGRSAVIASVGGDAFAVQLLDDRLLLEKVRAGTILENWQRAQASAMLD
jgi:hypothetical protein